MSLFIFDRTFHDTEINEEFMQHFLECFKLVLIHGQRENSINLCLDFIAKFAASYEVGNEDPDESGHPFYEGNDYYQIDLYQINLVINIIL